MSAAAPTLPAFDPRDPLSLDGLLDDEERLIRDTVRQYVREKFLPHVAGYFESGSLPETTGKELGDLGLLGMHRSEEQTSELRHGYISYAVFCLKKKKNRHLRIFTADNNVKVPHHPCHTHPD